MNSRETDAAWNMKGGTLSDKSARKEFGLTQEEIIKAINRGDLQYRVHSMYGNPFLRLIRREVEAFVEKKFGTIHLKQKKTQNELAQIDRDLRLLEKQVARLRKRRIEVLAALDQGGRRHSRPRPNRGGLKSDPKGNP